MMSNPASDIQSATIVCSIAICIVTTIFWWWWSRRRSLKTSLIPSTKTNNDNNNCNNPNCLRCYSKSQQHRDAFQANVTMLRRLVKLEPNLFDGMRQEIWSTIDDMLNIDDDASKIIDTSCDAPSSSDIVKGTNENTQPSLSPQPGQDPTVFFLTGLEATPFHHHGHFINMLDSSTNDESVLLEECPCNRLWKQHTAIPRTPDGNKKVYPPPIVTTGDVQVLKESYRIIRQELLDYLSLSCDNNNNESSFQPFDSKVYSSTDNTPSTTGTSNNRNNPEWSSLYLYHQGLKQSDICNTYFPQTTNILEMKCPHRMAGKCGLGSVYFSKLKRNTKVIEHCGPTNVRWRCHLPLIVPKVEAAARGGSCLRVGLPTVNEECVRWEEGIPILFDDSFLHSAVHSPNVVVKEEDDENNLDGARIVLIVDFWHPALAEMDRNALGVLYPPGS